MSPDVPRRAAGTAPSPAASALWPGPDPLAPLLFGRLATVSFPVSFPAPSPES